jgi:hypothetical protein
VRDEWNTTASVDSFRFVYRPTSTGVGGNEDIPISFGLEQNYPNPFNPTTKIRYQIAEVRSPAYATASAGRQKSEVGGRGTDVSHVTLKVFDVLGSEVATLVNDQLQPGSYVAIFNASALSGGVYFYRLQSGREIATRRMLLIK